MDIVLALKRIEEAEGAIADLYEWLSNKFLTDSAVCSFFANLGLDEHQHKNLAKLQLRHVLNDRSLFKDVEVDLKVIENQLQKIERFRNSPDFTVEDALRFSLEIEIDLCEQYNTSIMKQSNKELADFVDNLARACSTHYEHCREMAQKYEMSSEV